jgi:hypothetical protein
MPVSSPDPNGKIACGAGLFMAARMHAGVVLLAGVFSARGWAARVATMARRMTAISVAGTIRPCRPPLIDRDCSSIGPPSWFLACRTYPSCLPATFLVLGWVRFALFWRHGGARLLLETSPGGKRVPCEDDGRRGSGCDDHEDGSADDVRREETAALLVERHGCGYLADDARRPRCTPARRNRARPSVRARLRSRSLVASLSLRSALPMASTRSW